MWRKWICIGIAALVLPIVAPSRAICAQDVEIVVTRGDTLIHICKDYLEEVDDWPRVAAANPHIKDPHWIYPGEKVAIPAILLKGVPGGGKATFLKGVVEIQKSEDGPWVPLTAGDPLSEGIRVRTGEDGALEVSFEDGSSFYMRPATCLQVVKSRKSGALSIIGDLYLEGGRVITRIKKATGTEPRFQIRTPAAVAAVRGTDFRVSHDVRSSTRVEVLKGLVSAKGRQRKVLLEEGTGTLIRKGRDPEHAVELLPAPALVAPEPLYRKMPLEFRLAGIKGAETYRVQLARDPEMKDVIRDVVCKPSDAARMEGVADGTYYLQTFSTDRRGLEGPPSTVEPIHVRINPVPPFIQSPVNGKDYKTVTMEFSWLNVQDAVGYHLQIAEDPEFASIVEDRELTGKVEYKTKTLGPKSYYFRIRSIASDGYRGLWSDVLRFSLLPPPPAPVSEPPKVRRKEITIQWQNVGPGYTYHFQMSRDKDFDEILVDEQVKDSSIVIKKPKKAGTYYVRTSAVGADGFEGHFSSPQSFKKKRFPWEFIGSGAVIGTMLGLFLM